MSEELFDAIVVGSGPSGVSVAHPLLEAGWRVLMVDGGIEATISLPSEPLLTARTGSEHQWQWMIGKDFYYLSNPQATSPKFRVPTQRYAHEGFRVANHVDAQGMVAQGSMARGGLSVSWGCAVSCLSASELKYFPVSPSQMMSSYKRIVTRIGVSGSSNDDLSGFFGLDEWSQPPIALDTIHRGLIRGYESKRSGLIRSGFRMGRSRVAALSERHDGREACDLSGNCLWGCYRRSLYSAVDEHPKLLRHPNFEYESGLVVERVKRDGSVWRVEGRSGSLQRSVRARRVILAAGTLASTRLALLALEHRHPVALRSSPTAAFLLWLPRHLGARRENAFGLGQLSFTVDTDEGGYAYGSTYSTTGIPLSEFLPRIPFRRRYAIPVLRALMSSCLVGSCFLAGDLTDARVTLGSHDELRVEGGYADRVAGTMAAVATKLKRSFGHSGALLVPGSFSVGAPGSDVHYAGTLPMSSQPNLGCTDELGQVYGLSGVHVVDGACLPTLTAKPHTLTIMANADRIGRLMAEFHQPNAD